MSSNSVRYVVYDSAADATSESVEDVLGSTNALQVYRQVARKQQAYANFIVLHPSTTKADLARMDVESKDVTEKFLMRVETGVGSLLYRGDFTTPNVMNFVSETNIPLVTELEAHICRRLFCS